MNGERATTQDKANGGRDGGEVRGRQRDGEIEMEQDRAKESERERMNEMGIEHKPNWIN